MKEVKTVKGFRKALAGEIGIEQTEKLFESFHERYRELIEDNPDETPELKEHSVKIIYPSIAMADTLQKFGWSREKAIDWIYDYFEKDAEAGAASMRLMLKIPFAYKLVPGMFLSVQEKDFGANAGFDSEIVVNEKDHTVFHMLKCPYNDIFRRYGYPELVKCLCHQDDVKNSSMHKYLKWERSETLGQGDDHCDFDIRIEKK